MQQWRLLLQERIGPALEYSTLPIDREMPSAGIQNDLNIFPLQALADFESLAKQMDIAIGRDLPDESDPPSRYRQRFSRDEIPRG